MLHRSYICQAYLEQPTQALAYATESQSRGLQMFLDNETPEDMEEERSEGDHIRPGTFF